ncbi:MAG: cache domain-containing protein [Cyanobacteria bacterium J06642_9]
MPAFSIRKTIPILIVAPLLVTIGFMSALSIVYGRRSANQLAEELMQSTNDRIQDQVIGKLQEALLVNRLNASAIETGELQLSERREWRSFFASQIQVTPSMNYIFFGDQQGYFVGSRIQDGQRFTVFSGEDTGGRTYQFDVNEQGEVSPTPTRDYEYDPRNRPWYIAAIAANRPVWSDVYLGFTVRELLITAAHPVYDRTNQLIGVLGVDVLIGEVNRFLETLEIGETGEMFILEQNGMLVASSLGQTIVSGSEPSVAGQADTQLARVSAFDSADIIIRETANHLLQEYGDLSLIQNNIRLTRLVDDQRMFIAARPITDELGLEWLVVVVIPTRDFTGPLWTQSLIILIFTCIALLAALGLGWLVARWVAIPILNLHKAAVDVKSQSFNPHDIEYLNEREDEIGQFAHVFSEMAEIIGEREESIEEQLKYLRLQGPLGVRRSLDLSSLRSLQQKAKVIRDVQNQR